MKSNIFKYLIICLAIGSIATECNKEEEKEDPQIIATFTITPENGTTATNFIFDASNSMAGGPGATTSEDLSFSWDFDYTGPEDLFWDIEKTSEKIVIHNYNEVKNYKVLLKVEWSGYDETETKFVEVTSNSNTPPVAAFIAIPSSGTAPLTVYFTDQSMYEPTSWLWDFGNGEPSTEQNPSYTYNNVGTYTIKLTATNDHGSDDEEKDDYISVTNGDLGIPCPTQPMVTDFEGNEYNTVLIGDQCWMKENLKTTSYNDGTPIPNVTDGLEWYWLTTGAYVLYENEIVWKDKYGALYNFSAVVNPHGLCPTGWHAPTKDEMLELTDYIGGTTQDGIKLKSCRQVNSPLGGDCNTTEHPRWDENYYYGTDIYGFSGLPGGHRGYTNNSAFYSLGTVGWWWTSTHTPSSQTSAYYFTLSQHTTNWFQGSYKKGYSVRCLKND